MSEQFPADPAAITAHALRIFSYQNDLEHASATLRQTSASDGAFGLMAGPLIAPLFQLVEVGEHLAISGAECALDKLGQTLVASARAVQVGESSQVTIPEAGVALWGDGCDS